MGSWHAYEIDDELSQELIGLREENAWMDALVKASWKIG
jgi:hypothetical protein